MKRNDFAPPTTGCTESQAHRVRQMLLLLADVRSEVWIAERNLEKAVTIHLERNLRRVREIGRAHV